MKRIQEIIKNCKDPKLAKELRQLYTTKLAQQANESDASILSHTHGGVVDYETRKHPRVGRGTKDSGEYEVRQYDTGPEHEKFTDSIYEAPRSMSTRYSPDRPGVQARFVSDGVRQDPYTNKIYNWNEGFKTEDGSVIPAGGVGLQSDLYSNATLNGISFTKGAQILPGEEDDMPEISSDVVSEMPHLSGDMSLAEGLQALLEAGVTSLEEAMDILLDNEGSEGFEDAESEREWQTDRDIFRDIESSKRRTLSKISQMSNATPQSFYGYVLVDPASKNVVSDIIMDQESAASAAWAKKEQGLSLVICKLLAVN